MPPAAGASERYTQRFVVNVNGMALPTSSKRCGGVAKSVVVAAGDAAP